MILSCIENSDKALNENGCLPRKVDNAWYQIYGSYGYNIYFWRIFSAYYFLHIMII